MPFVTQTTERAFLSGNFAVYRYLHLHKYKYLLFAIYNVVPHGPLFFLSMFALASSGDIPNVIESKARTTFCTHIHLYFPDRIILLYIY